MKIFRRGHTSIDDKLTDEVPASKIGKRWLHRRGIEFDGTIDKAGSRGTSITVRIEEEDILALHAALIKHYTERQQELVVALKTIDLMTEAFDKITQLTSDPSQAPSQEKLLDGIEDIANHYASHPRRKPTFESKHPWMK